MQRHGSTKSQQVNGISTVSENHLFYMNRKDNNIKPPWYINCSRKESEEILKKHREYGNVLLRPNSNFAVNGSYALSAVTISSGDDKYVHYVISRATNGFKLEVQSKPAPMACLHDVLDYYIKAAGCQTHHAMVIDPTETSKGKTVVCRNPIAAKINSDYVNLSESNAGRPTSVPVDEELYLPMNRGSNGKKSHEITRRCSAPVNKRDYVNMPKATGANASANDHYINGKELDLNESKGRDGHDYINVANAIPGRICRSSLPKANSFPLPRREGFDDDDDEEDDYDSPTYLAPEPPIFAQDIRPSSIHEPPGY